MPRRAEMAARERLCPQPRAAVGDYAQLLRQKEAAFQGIEAWRNPAREGSKLGRPIRSGAPPGLPRLQLASVLCIGAKASLTHAQFDHVRLLKCETCTVGGDQAG